ncbi:MAG TPA: amylo-alpha-1,6-glucosidase, partial [Coleofasciculaceae cyanobacterium]
DVLDSPTGDDPSLRPNQIFAVSLPESPLTPVQQKGVVDACGRSLLTSYGLRSLAPDHPDYQGHYGGNQRQRDGSYHQGTVWGWLLGPFAIAHLRVYGDLVQARQFLEPMADHLCNHGVGSLSEIFDGDAPFQPRGCVAQAWTVAEVLHAWMGMEREKG